MLANIYILWFASAICGAFGVLLLVGGLIPQTWRDQIGWLKVNHRFGDGFRPGYSAPVSLNTVGGRIVLILLGLTSLLLAVLVALHASQ